MIRRALTSTVLAALFLAIAFTALRLIPQPELIAAPLAEDVPLSHQYPITGVVTATSTFLPEPWSHRQMGGPTTADFFAVVTMTTVNTTGYTLQVSPDGTIWANHPTACVAGCMVYTTTTMPVVTNVLVMGSYFRIAQTVTNTSPITSVIWVTVH